MKNYKKGQYTDAFGDEHNYILTHNVGLTAALGSIGYEVILDSKKGNCFPHYRITIDKDIDENISRYYLGHITVNAYLLATNIEILSNISSEDSISISVPLKSSPKDREDYN